VGSLQTALAGAFDGRAPSRDRLDRVAAAAERAAGRVVEEAKRRAELRRVLDRDLWDYVPGLAAGTVLRPEAVTLAVLLTDLDRPTLDTVEHEGLAVQGRSETGEFVVGRFTADPSLERLALLPEVLRVELVR
jgi:hypothetical protein